MKKWIDLFQRVPFIHFKAWDHLDVQQHFLSSNTPVLGTQPALPSEILWHRPLGIFVGSPRNSVPSPKQPVLWTLKHVMFPFISWIWHGPTLCCFLKRSLKWYVYDNINCLQGGELGVCRTRLGVKGFLFVFSFGFPLYILLNSLKVVPCKSIVLKMNVVFFKTCECKHWELC